MSLANRPDGLNLQNGIDGPTDAFQQIIQLQTRVVDSEVEISNLKLKLALKTIQGAPPKNSSLEPVPAQTIQQTTAGKRNCERIHSTNKQQSCDLSSVRSRAANEGKPEVGTKKRLLGGETCGSQSHKKTDGFSSVASRRKDVGNGDVGRSPSNSNTLERRNATLKRGSIPGPSNARSTMKGNAKSLQRNATGSSETSRDKHVRHPSSNSNRVNGASSGTRNCTDASSSRSSSALDSDGSVGTHTDASSSSAALLTRSDLVARLKRLTEEHDRLQAEHARLRSFLGERSWDDRLGRPVALPKTDASPGESSRGSDSPNCTGLEEPVEASDDQPNLDGQADEFYRQEILRLREELQAVRKQKPEVDKKLEETEAKVYELEMQTQHLQDRAENSSAHQHQLAEDSEKLKKDLMTKEELMLELEKRNNRLHEQLCAAENRALRLKERNHSLTQQLKELEYDSSETKEFMQVEMNTLLETVQEAEASVAKFQQEEHHLRAMLETKSRQVAEFQQLTKIQKMEMDNTHAELETVKAMAREVLLKQGSELTTSSISLSQLAHQLQAVVQTLSSLEDTGRDCLQSAAGEEAVKTLSVELKPKVGNAEAVEEDNGKRPTGLLEAVMLAIGSKSLSNSSSSTEGFHSCVATVNCSPECSLANSQSSSLLQVCSIEQDIPQVGDDLSSSSGRKENNAESDLLSAEVMQNSGDSSDFSSQGKSRTGENVSIVDDDINVPSPCSHGEWGVRTMDLSWLQNQKGELDKITSISSSETSSSGMQKVVGQGGSEGAMVYCLVDQIKEVEQLVNSLIELIRICQLGFDARLAQINDENEENIRKALDEERRESIVREAKLRQRMESATDQARARDDQLRCQLGEERERLKAAQAALQQSSEKRREISMCLDQFGDQQIVCDELKHLVQKLEKANELLTAERDAYAEQLKDSIAQFDEIGSGQISMDIMAEKYAIKRENNKLKTTLCQRNEEYGMLQERLVKHTSILNGNWQRAEKVAKELDLLIGIVSKTLQSIPEVVGSCPELQALWCQLTPENSDSSSTKEKGKKIAMADDFNGHAQTA